MADLENGPSWRDQFDQEMWDIHFEDCPKHGDQRVVGQGTTGGPDPWSTDKLECGCEILDMGVGYVRIIRKWRDGQFAKDMLAMFATVNRIGPLGRCAVGGFDSIINGTFEALWAQTRQEIAY